MNVKPEMASKPPEAGRGAWNGSLPRSSQRDPVLPTSWPRTPGLQKWDTVNICGDMFRAPYQTDNTQSNPNSPLDLERERWEIYSGHSFITYCRVTHPAWRKVCVRVCAHRCVHCGSTCGPAHVWGSPVPRPWAPGLCPLQVTFLLRSRSEMSVGSHSPLPTSALWRPRSGFRG